MLVPSFDQYEVLLCVQDHDDPAIDVCKKLLGKYPNVDARLFIGKYQGSCQTFCFGSFKCQESSLQQTLDQALGKVDSMLALSVFPRGRGKIIPLILGKLWGKKSWLPNDIQIISCSIIRCICCFVFLLKSFFLFSILACPSVQYLSSLGILAIPAVSGRFPSHGVDLSYNQIHIQSVTLTLVCLCCISVFYRQVCGAPSSTMSTSQWGEGSSGHQLDFSMFSEICRCCLQQWGLTVSLWEATNGLGDSLGSLEDFKGPLWPTT